MPWRAAGGAVSESCWDCSTVKIGSLDVLWVRRAVEVVPGS